MDDVIGKAGRFLLSEEAVMLALAVVACVIVFRSLGI
jgi:hypothetical protein